MLRIPDYLVKPYAVGELLARIRAVTRRPGNFHAGVEKCFADLRLDADRRELSGPGGTVRLSKRETALMEYLIRGAGQILPREIILTYIWGVDAEVEDDKIPWEKFVFISCTKRIKLFFDSRVQKSFLP